VDHSVIRVQVVKDGIGVAGVGGGEHGDFGELRNLLQALDGIWSDVNRSLNLLPRHKRYINRSIIRIRRLLRNAMYQRFIQIKNRQLFEASFAGQRNSL
jgi:hypothetical protein